MFEVYASLLTYAGLSIYGVFIPLIKKEQYLEIRKSNKEILL